MIQALRATPLRPSPEPRLTLGDDEAHLHVLFLQSFARSSEHDLLARFGALMEEEEREKQARFVFERGRREYLLTRALARTTLARYTGAPAEDLRFALNEWGKPSLVGFDLTFNLSNTEGCVVCLVARGTREVGVDVENVARAGETVELAASHFAASEHTRLLKLAPGAAQRRRFFDLWTLKESYIKARGMGLALPLDGFAFDLESAPGAIGFTADPSIDPEPSTWEFAQYELGPTHLAASALRKSDAARVAVVLHDASTSPALRL